MYSTHRGCHINTVLPAIQDCEYVASRVGNTHDSFSAVRQWLDVGASVRRRSRRLQHEGGEVEKHGYEMVNHILRNRRGIRNSSQKTCFKFK